MSARVKGVVDRTFGNIKFNINISVPQSTGLGTATYGTFCASSRIAHVRPLAEASRIRAPTVSVENGARRCFSTKPEAAQADLKDNVRVQVEAVMKSFHFHSRLAWADRKDCTFREVTTADQRASAAETDQPGPCLSAQNELECQPPEDVSTKPRRNRKRSRIASSEAVCAPFVPLGAKIVGTIGATYKVPRLEHSEKTLDSKVRVSLIRGKDIEYVDRGPCYVPPRCEFFGTCGGCAFQSTSYAAQLQEKTKHVSKILCDGQQQACRLSHVMPCVSAAAGPVDHVYGYRNRVDFSCGVDKSTGQVSLGFRPFSLPQEKWRDEVVDITRCHLIDDDANAVLEGLRRFVRSPSFMPELVNEVKCITLRTSPVGSEKSVYIIVSSEERHASASFYDLPRLMSLALATVLVKTRIVAHWAPTSIPRPIQAELKAKADEEMGCVSIPPEAVDTVRSTRTLVQRSLFLAGSDVNANVAAMDVLYEIQPQRFLTHWQMESALSLAPATWCTHFHVSPFSFVQPNKRGGDAIISCVAAYLALLRAEGYRVHQAWDLFCGTGMLGTSLLHGSMLDHLVGIDFGYFSIKDAIHNCLRLGITPAQAQYHCLDLAHIDVDPRPAGSVPSADVTQAVYAEMPQQFLPYSQLHVSKAGLHLPFPDVVIVDPPRSGVGKPLLELFVKHQFPAIIYVSCNVTSMAADLRYLVDHGFRVRMVQPIDQFPHTQHVEVVALLQHEKPREVAESTM